MSLNSYIERLENTIHTRSDIDIEQLSSLRTKSSVIFEATLIFYDDSKLFVLEELELRGLNVFNRIIYSYHYQDKENQLIFRYDNAPHFPNLPTFPSHKHVLDKAIAASPPDLAEVLREIDELIYPTTEQSSTLTMKILLIGSGGREHAIAWKLAQSEQVAQIYVAPGNGGTAQLEKIQNVPIPVDDLQQLHAFAVEQAIDLAVVGPEGPLVAGIVDHFTKAGLAIFGPCQGAAQLEGSKAFSKNFMNEHGIPTGWAETFTDLHSASTFLHTLETLPVIKASGLAAGKGVILPETMDEAEEALRSILLEKRFGEAGNTVLIEERLVGPELSILAFCDGKSLHIMPPAQDHKRLMDGDQGPNTGGMGAFTPSMLATPELLEMVEREVFLPTLQGMAAAETPYVGVLYAGLMLTDAGPKVLEFNCRFGDPETQVVLPCLESDLVELFMACVQGRLSEITPSWSEQAAATVVMASSGYPERYPKGLPITGLEAAEASGCTVFHAGTKYANDQLVTDGGRVLAVTARGDDLNQALDQAYTGVTQIQFEGAFYRRDIGQKI